MRARSASWLGMGLLWVAGEALGGPTSYREPHPWVPEGLHCRYVNRPYVQARLYNDDRRLAVFSSSVGGAYSGELCANAVRRAREGRVCAIVSREVRQLEVATGAAAARFGAASLANFRACLDDLNPRALASSPGHVTFIAPDELAAFKALLPRVDDPSIQAVLEDPRTMWYDENSFVYTYQDSIGRPQGPEGLRANRVGYDVGANASVADIRALTEYFSPGHFRAPFRTAAGTDKVTEKYILNFWLPPRDADGEVLPVVHWRERVSLSLGGTRWRWAFPVGTVFGEVLFQRDPAGEWHAFGVRTRTRFIDTWAVDAFRPFPTAAALAAAIRAERPGFASDPQLRALMDALEGTPTLFTGRIDGVAYAKIFKPITGTLQRLPPVDDFGFTNRLLATTTFRSVLGVLWRDDGGHEVLGAVPESGYGIAPANYRGAVIPVNDESCRRCHAQTGRPLYQIDSRTTLYGEVWGEDEIFTWHPFAVNLGTRIYSVTDGNRRLNPRLVAAGLVRESVFRPQPGTASWDIWRPLPRGYKGERRRTRGYVP